MALRSRYKERPVEAPNIPEEPPQPSESVKIDFATDKAEAVEPGVTIVGANEPGDAVTEALQKAVEADEAALSLRRQLEHLRTSEALQRQHVQQMAQQHAAQMAAPAPSLPAEPEARIALWREHGLSAQDAAYLQERPQMVEFPMVTKAAYAATLQSGVERDSPAFAETMEGNFAALLNRAQAQARPAATDPAGFFRAPEPSRSPAAPDRASIYSAPVSRQAPSTGYREPSPSQVKLSPEEMQIAAASGISQTEYARHKLKMLRAKASGELQ